jgi:hypothetical protein
MFVTTPAPIAGRTREYFGGRGLYADSRPLSERKSEVRP